MPNYVRNIVKMQGIGNLPLYSMEPTDGKADGNEVAAPQEYFDFDKIIPMPKSLEMGSGTSEDVAMEAALTCIAGVVAKDSFIPPFIVELHMSRSQGTLEERAKQCGMTVREAEELGLKYLENIIRYGHSSWYRWCIENWGTKWNSYDLERIDEDTIAFSTAWADPGPVIEAMSSQYPDRMIEHWWADEDMGENTGYRCIQDGCGETVTPDGGSSEALELYVRCWGMDDCLERDEKGNLHVIGEEEESEEE